MSDTQQYLTFAVGEDRFAARAADVSEVVRRPRVVRVPRGPRSLLGLTSFRGAPVPVVSLARLLGQDDADGADRRLLVLNGQAPVGLMIDQVGTLTSLEGAAAGMDGARQGFGRLFVRDGSALRTLDLDGLLRHEFAGLTKATAPHSSDAALAATSDRQAEDAVALLSFDLAGQVYAFGLDQVTGVMPLPTQMATPAQTDAALLGVVAVRQRLLPIVSLRHLLGLPIVHALSQRVVVIRMGAAQIGVAVDQLRAILRVTADAIDIAPAVLNRGEGDAQVGAIARLADNGGLVGILTGERLFRDQKVALILADGQADAEDPVVAAGDIGEHAPFLIFQLGDEEYGLPLSAVDEVVRAPDQLAQLPKAPAFIKGVLNLRGHVVPVVDQRDRFEIAAGRVAARPRIIVSAVEGRRLGFIVDAVSEILPLAARQIEATPSLAADDDQVFSRVATLDDGARMILLVEPQALLQRAERDLLAAFATSGATTA